MRWQILICSVWARTALLEQLLDVLAPQLSPYVTVLIHRDNGELPVGVKRTLLVREATADYVSFVDDDDMVSTDYVDRIMDGLHAEPDCVGFYLDYKVDGRSVKLAMHSASFEVWAEGPDYFERTPNHLNPVRREHAVAGLPFLPGFGEDRDWSERIHPLLNVETMLLRPPVYEYRYSPTSSLFAGGVRSVDTDPGLRAFPFVRLLGHPGAVCAA